MNPLTPEYLAECTHCNGAGYTIEVQAVCCGNVHDNGECRGHCPIPEQYQEACAACGGSGTAAKAAAKIKDIMGGGV